MAGLWQWETTGDRESKTSVFVGLFKNAMLYNPMLLKPKGFFGMGLI